MERLVEFFSPASSVEGDLPRTGRETRISPDALLLLFPAGTTSDFLDVPDDEDHPTRVREVPGL